MKKKIIAVFLTALMVMSISACGDDKDDYEKAADRIENMSDSELEDAILDGAAMLG